MSDIYIYQIYDNTNGNSYVGSTNNIYRRIGEHMRCDKTSSAILKNKDYKINILEMCDLKNKFEREQYHIDNTPNTINKQKAKQTKNLKEQWHDYYINNKDVVQDKVLKRYYKNHERYKKVRRERYYRYKEIEELNNISLDIFI